MRSVRVFYRKNGPLRFVSHLDMSRLVTRMLRRTGLEVWYTEGFNSRLYINFALPLSLGFTSNYECFDFKLQQETLKLPAGGENNINPTLLLKAFSEQTGLNPGYAVCRTALYLANGNKFI